MFDCIRVFVGHCLFGWGGDRELVVVEGVDCNCFEEGELDWVVSTQDLDVASNLGYRFESKDHSSQVKPHALL